MRIDRREWIAGAASLLFSGNASAQAPAAFTSANLPDKKSFPIVGSKIFLNGARWHPMSLAGADAIRTYQDYTLTRSPKARELTSVMEAQVRITFAALINAHPAEIAFVQSTMMAENLVLLSLGLPKAPYNIVTDTLHYQASVYMYRTLQSLGHDIRIVEALDGRVDIKALEKVVDGNTRLVAISLVSFANGFQHDLKAVCDLAHLHGAYVYADAVQAVGALPVDVRSTNVDFCACSSYKWLMGDMGIGFLYARADLLGTVVRRTLFGKMQITGYENHIFPFDTPMGAPDSWQQVPGAAGYFEVGSHSLSGIACLSQSLPYIQRIGVEAIQAHARSLTARLQAEMPKMGFIPLTPHDGAGHIVAFSMKNPDRVQAAMQEHAIDVTFDQHRVRISPSVFNDHKDVDALLSALHGVQCC